MRVIAVANQKGGCAKTTTAINLSACLAFLGKKTLLVDVDPQAHATLGLGLKSEDLQHTIYDLLIGPEEEGASAPAAGEVRVRIANCLDLIPSDITVSGIEQRLSKVPGREERLHLVLRDFAKEYDFVIIDSPPYLGMLTFNALRAATEVVVPVEASFFSLHGLAKIAETLELLKQEVGHEVSLHALITLMDRRTRLARQVAHEVAEYYGERMLRTIIHHNSRLREAAAAGKSIVDFDRNCSGFSDYMNLARELMERGAREAAPSEELAPVLQALSEGLASNEEAAPRSPVAEEMVLEERAMQQALEEAAHGREVEPGAVAAPPGSGEKMGAGQAPALAAPGSPGAATDEARCLPIREITQSPLKTSNGFVFLCRAPGAHRVQIIGDFTKWIPQEMNTPGGESGFWSKTFSISSGPYKYRFIIDGEWTHDVNNPDTQPNPYGGKDSLLNVE